jgi:hypothetical protein
MCSVLDVFGFAGHVRWKSIFIFHPRQICIPISPSIQHELPMSLVNNNSLSLLTFRKYQSLVVPPRHSTAKRIRYAKRGHHPSSGTERPIPDAFWCQNGGAFHNPVSSVITGKEWYALHLVVSSRRGSGRSHVVLDQPIEFSSRFRSIRPMMDGSQR